MDSQKPLWDRALAIPAVVALLTFLVIIAALYLLKNKQWGFGGFGGTHYVTNAEGQSVRRSTRSRKSVSRWSPEDRNSPGESTPVSAALLAKIEALETAEKKAGTPLAVKRGPGRQPKTPKAATPAVAAEPSTMRTRGSARTPAK